MTPEQQNLATAITNVDSFANYLKYAHPECLTQPSQPGLPELVQQLKTKFTELTGENPFKPIRVNP